LKKEGKNMFKLKGITTLGVILLFMGLAFSPAIAQTPAKEGSEASTISTITPVQLSEKDVTTVEKFLPTLFDRLQGATTLSDVVNTLQGMTKEYGRHPVEVLLLKLVIKMINFPYKFSQLRPVRKSAFILSMGFTNKIITPAKYKMNVVKPFTAWYYTGKSNLLLNSRTIIFDLRPFSIKSLTGRQVGVMSNFIGLYIHLPAKITDKGKTFFFGYAGTIRGFDLSPFKN